MKMVKLHMVGLKDDASQDKSSVREFVYDMDRQTAVNGDERPTSAPAVAGDVVFYTTTTEFPSDPCRCHESSLYALTYDGNVAYGAGTGGERCSDRDGRNGEICACGGAPRVKTVPTEPQDARAVAQ